MRQYKYNTPEDELLSMLKMFSKNATNSENFRNATEMALAMMELRNEFRAAALKYLTDVDKIENYDHVEDYVADNGVPDDYLMFQKLGTEPYY